MSKNIAVFENKNVEVFEWNGDVLFNPYHVGECLGLGDSAVRMAIANMNDKQVVKIKKSNVNTIDNLVIPTSGRVFLTESGVYKLIFKSRKKEAEKFADWVTDEVLPSIRKTGQYAPTKPVSPLPIPFKTYQGKPVMVIQDVVKLTGEDPRCLNARCNAHGISRTYLSGDDTRAFKAENPGKFSTNLSHISLLTEEPAKTVMGWYGIPAVRVEAYFRRALSAPQVPVAVPVDSPVPSLRLKIETAEELLRTAKELLDTCV